MFSGKKFRLWSRQSSSSKKEKDAEKEPSKDKRRSIQPKTENETLTSNIFPFFQENAQAHVIQKLREDNARLEESVKELLPYKTHAEALERKLLATTKSFEKKEVKYSAAVSSLEYENEQLQQEIKRVRTTCVGCFFCTRQQQLSNHPETASAKLLVNPVATQDFISKSDEGSIESMQSSESWRRLGRLEEEQSAIVKETLRQKKETSRCLQQISNELVKALVSQKSLRKDCTQLQERICQLEKQNEHLNKVIFRQYTPSSSSSSSLQTRHPTVKRNEASACCHPEVTQTLFWGESMSRNICSTPNTQNVEEKPKHFRTPAVPPYRSRFGKEIDRTPQNYASKDYIPEVVRENVTSARHILTNQDHTSDGPLMHLRNQKSLTESEPRSPKHDWKDSFLVHEVKERNVCSWETSTSSTITLHDETEERHNNTTGNSHQNTLTRGSNFSLNDILDGDIDELRLSIQNLESTRHNNSARSLHSSVDEYLKEPVQPQGLCDIHSTDMGVSKPNNSVEKRYRYSYPVTSSSAKPAAAEKSTMLGENTEKHYLDEDQTSDEEESLLPNKQKQMEATLQKIENVINSSSTDELRTGEPESPPDTEFQSLHGGNCVTDPNTGDTTSDDDLVWNLVQIDGKCGTLLHNETDFQNDSLMDISGSEFTHETNIIDEYDHANHGDKYLSEIDSLQRQTSQLAPGKIPFLCGEEYMQQCDFTDEEMCNADSKECEAKLEPELNDRDASEPEISEFRKDFNEMETKSEDKLNIRRYSLTNENLSKDSVKDINVTKDKVTALTAYFEEVHAEQCPGCQHSNPKCRSSSFASKSSTNSKDSSSFDDDDDDSDDTSMPGNAVHGHMDEFQTIRHLDYQKINAKLAEETERCTTKVHGSDRDKPSAEEISKHEAYLLETSQHNETVDITPESEKVTSENIEEGHTRSTPDVASVDLKTDISVLHDDSEQRKNETVSAQNALESTLQESKLLPSEMEYAEHDARTSLTSKMEVKRLPVTSSRCLVDKQMHCKSLPSYLPSAANSISPLHVNYVRTCSLKSFWNVVSPPHSPYSQKQEDQFFPGETQINAQVDEQIHRDEDVIKDNTPRDTQIRNEDNVQGHLQYQCHNEDDVQGHVQSQCHNEDPFTKESSLTQLETESLSQNLFSFLLPGINQGSSEDASTNEVKNNFRSNHQGSSTRNKIKTDDYEGISNSSMQMGHREKLPNYEHRRTDPICYEMSFLDRPDPNYENLGSLSKYEALKNKLQPDKSGCLPENPPEGILVEPTDYEFEHMLSSMHAKLPKQKSQSSRIDERKETHTGTLTEEDIRKYQLDCQDYNKTTTAGENHSWSPLYNRMVPLMEMNNFEDANLRSVSSKPPIPPRRFHITRYYVPDNDNPAEEIPDYEELEDEVVYYPSGEKTSYGNEFSADDNRRNWALDMERNAFSSAKRDIHIPGSTSASTDFQLNNSAFHDRQVQFRNYSKSWESGKRNSYPAARFRSYSQPEEQWDNVPTTDSTRHHPLDFGRNARPLSAYHAFDTLTRGSNAEVPPRPALVHRQPPSSEKSQKLLNDAENDLVFYEIAKQIETLKQTVSDLQNKKTDSG